MREFSAALLALLLAGAGLQGIAQARPGANGDPHGCVNPAGHVRGWCKNGSGGGSNRSYRGGNMSTISGTVIAANGDLVQLREDNGAMITVNEQSLLRAGSPLQIGGHYTLRGTFSNNLFIAQNGGTDGYPNNNNGYPGSNASIHGVVTSVSGNRVTVLQGLFSTITIDDQQALNNGAAQNLYVGRSITAYGFWSGSVFYATSIG
ncbi:MAG: hypothetical protein ABR508_04735 [Candidatus Baltobacteraceae bacterium]